MKRGVSIFWLFIIMAGLAGLNSPWVMAQNFADRPPVHEEPQAVTKADPSQSDQELSAEEILKKTKFFENGKQYTLGRDDVLDISIMRHPEVSGQYIINAEGNIQYEFVGDIRVSGLTKDEVRDAIAEKLSNFIVSPDVTVKIVGYNSKVVYVIGEVGRPGKIFMRGDTITVREALLEAGLPLLTASPKKGRLITPSMTGKPEQKKVNVEALLYKGDLRENLVMKPGDTLYIPATVLAKAMRAIYPVTQPVGEAAGTTRAVYPGF